MELRGATVYRDGRLTHQNVLIHQGRVDCSPFHRPHRVLDLTDMFLLPGLVDVHVHLREPGFLLKETMLSGTQAAARGGYTTVCAMPNLAPPPDTPQHLAAQLAAIQKDALVRVKPYGCITRGQKGEGELADYAALMPSVIAFSDDGRGVQSESTMRSAMEAVRRIGGMICAHCEDNALLHGGVIHDGAYARAHGHKGICSQSEWGQVQRDLRLAKETGCCYHVCHVSCKESIDLIRQAKREGVDVTCETAPHYLLLCEDDLQEDGRFKMNPPLRTAEDRDALLEGLLDGTIDIIATDHAPHTAEEKGRGLDGSLMGVVGLETALPVLYTGLVKTGKVPLETILCAMTDAPRRRFGLPEMTFAAGQAADLCVYDLREEYIIDPDEFASQGRATPFAGQRVLGRCKRTVVGGETVWESN